MYSVVLAAMLTAGTTTTPQWHHGCYGCHGCWGCCGGCWGCCGGYYGCCGGYYGCHGCWGCCGGYGGYTAAYPYYGGYGCYGIHSYYGCSGCWGVFGCGGGYAVSVAGAGYATPLAAAAPAAPERGLAATTASPATVVVQMPNAGKLYVEGQLVQLDPKTNSFTTPQLPATEDFVYTLKVEAVRDGRVVTESKDVHIRAGQVARVDFGAAQQAPVAVRVQEAVPVTSRITVRLPENARLYVNDKQLTLNPTTQSFETPQLQAEREYSYTMRAEVVREGRVVTDTKQVVFRAGKPATVDFSELSVPRVARR